MLLALLAWISPVRTDAQPADVERMNAEILRLFEDARYAEAIPLARDVVRILEQTRGPDDLVLAVSLNRLARLLEVTGDFAGARALYERALHIRERALGPEHVDVSQVLNNLGGVLIATGDFAGGRAMYERALEIRERALGPMHTDVALSLNNLAYLLHVIGDYRGSRPLYERALRIYEQAYGPWDLAVATNLGNLASLLFITGEYAAARPMLERALRIRERIQGPEHPDVAAALNNIGFMLQTIGDYAGAQPVLERALRIKEKVWGPGHPDVAFSLVALARVQALTGQYAAARPLLERAAEIYEHALGPDHPELGRTLNDLALILQNSGDTTAARPLYERALAINERAFGPSHPAVGLSLNNLGYLLEQTGDRARARPILERSLRILEQRLGPSHPEIAYPLNNLAMLVESMGDHAAARVLYERARLAALALARAGIELDDDAQRALQQTRGGTLRAYAGLLATIARENANEQEATAASHDAFVVAEQARGGAAQVALARAAARAAGNDAAAANDARRVESLRERLAAARKLVVAEQGRPSAQQDPARLRALQTDTERLERELQDAATRLRAAFPRYGDLALPEPIDVATARRLLRADEAMVSFFALEDRLLLWVVRPGRPAAYRDIAMSRKDLETLVARVRRSLDQSAEAALDAGLLAPFDVAGAHALHALLFGTVARELTDVRHLLIVPDATLLPLPFGALLTDAGGKPARALAELHARGLNPSPAELIEYTKLAWLARRHSLTVLPSATSLRALREIPRARVAAAEPLIAFGDPVLDGTGRQRGGRMIAARGASVSVADLRKLDRLPGTRDELLALAKALRANPATALNLDARATETEVARINTSGRLNRARVLAFATHGLVGGEVRGLRQPALVLTPPAQPSEQDDGLLTLDDITGLSLGAEWVVLSACNTAGADGSGEGLSGLVRAFFFAGAPSLLVSHWSVDDRATQALMTRVFERYTRQRDVRKADALRQGMLELMSAARGTTAYFAHPFAWASFFLVGENR